MNHHLSCDSAGISPCQDVVYDSVVVPPSFLERMLEHARSCAPYECCGVVGGKGRIVTSVHPLRNDLESATQFFADPKELIDAVKKMRKSGEEMIGIYHSHPDSLAVPSQRDREENYYVGYFYFIISLMTENPIVRCYVMSHDREFTSVQII
ncbi:MAG: M67 family peptidase [Candidatus Omnitrophota bacterium]|jgi:proteasome lid subunit RPN8/RPN11|nr:MAG: M67 family peptidase [Candidatus Omnitrophota bacterium]